MPLLVDFTNRIMNEWKRICHHYFEDIKTKRMPLAQNEHRKILTFLQSGDAEGLDALAIEHNRSANKAYQEILQERNE